MHIAIVTGEYPPDQGGVGAYSHIVARQLVSQGHIVSVYTSRQSQRLMPPPDANMPDLHHYPISHRRWGLHTLRQMVHHMRTRSVDIVNIQFQTAAFSMSPWIHFLPHLTGPLPVVTTFHDLRYPYLFPKAGGLRDWIVMHLAKTSAGVIVTNQEDFTRVQELETTAVIPIGSNIAYTACDDVLIAELRTNIGAGPDDFLLAHFGFMNHSKGVDLLLQAAAHLVPALPLRLLMIGGRTGTSDPTNQEYVTYIDQQIRQYGLEPYITWTDYIDDTAVSAYLQAADVVVLPFRDGASYRRGTLMAAVEHGCAILTTEPAADVPTFRDRENMRLVPREDPQALASAIQELHTDTALRTRLRRGAVQLRTQFDWDAIAMSTLRVFQRVLEKQP